MQEVKGRYFIFLFYSIITLITCFNCCLGMQLNQNLLRQGRKEIQKSVASGDEANLKHWFFQLRQAGIAFDLDELYYDGQNPYKTTLLHNAIFWGYVSIVRFLLEQGANPNTRVEENVTPLHYACFYGNKDIVLLLIEHGAVCNVFTKKKWTPLHFASQKGYADIVRILTENGAQIDALEKTLLTPLHVACFHGHVDVVKVLLEFNAQCAVIDQEFLTPLHLACLKNHPAIVELLLYAIKQLDDYKITCLDRLDLDKWSPLHMACQSGAFECVALLIDCGADVNIPDINKWTPLHVASFFNHADIVKLLLEHGADSSVQTSTGASVLSLSCQQGNAQTCILLLEYCNVDPWYFDTTDVDCAVCLESFYDKDICVRLSCLHVFHVKCVQQLNKKKCPLCRKAIQDLTDPKSNIRFFIFKKEISSLMNSNRNKKQERSDNGIRAKQKIFHLNNRLNLDTNFFCERCR